MRKTIFLILILKLGKNKFCIFNTLIFSLRWAWRRTRRAFSARFSFSGVVFRSSNLPIWTTSREDWRLCTKRWTPSPTRSRSVVGCSSNQLLEKKKFYGFINHIFACHRHFSDFLLWPVLNSSDSARNFFTLSRILTRETSDVIDLCIN